MNYVSRVTVQSTTCPGVSFEIRKMTEKRRVSREISIADLRVKVQEQSQQLSELVERTSPADLLSPAEVSIETHWAKVASDTPEAEPPEALTLVRALKAERLKNRELRGALPEIKPGEVAHANAAFDNTLHAEWYPAWITWGLHSIAGLDIDGAPATADSLIESGPPELVTEIFTAIQEASGLSAAKEKNSPPPGSLGDQADGPTSSSTASDAERQSGTSNETAPSTSPAT